VVLARVEVQRGNEEQALARLDASSARRDELGLAPVEGLELTRGDALARLERGAEAEAAFSAEIEAFPEKPEPYARLAVLYRVAGRWADVHDILETLVERVPTVPAHLLAARTLEALGDRDRADRLRRRADALADAAPVCCP
jgi:tetratricopeptide (TPR) repeat protein